MLPPRPPSRRGTLLKPVGAHAGAVPRRKERTPPVSIDDLPEAHQIVLRLMVELDQGQGVRWEKLRDAAAELGIGERELREVVGASPNDGGA